MTIKQQISEVEGVVDIKAAKILREIKMVVENITGRREKGVVKLGADATLAGVINKVNEIIKLLQDE